MVEIITAAAQTGATASVAEACLLEPLPSFFDKPQPGVVVKNLGQMVQVRAFESLLETIYGKPTTLSTLLKNVGCESLTVELLEQLGYAPVCAELFEQFSKQMSITEEGRRSFNAAKLLYGFYGGTPCTSSAIALKLELTTLETKQLLIRLKARLQSQLVRDLLEGLLNSVLANFMRTSLYRALRMQKRSVQLIEWPVNTEKSHMVEELTTLMKTVSTINVSCGNGLREAETAYSLTLDLAAAGKKVLLVNHSRMLALHLRNVHNQNVTSEGSNNPSNAVTISTFHAFCHWAAQAAQLKTPRSSSARIFNETFPELLVEAVHLRPENQFDAIIVLEGHCFGPNMWRSLKHCLRDTVKGHYVYFYDPQLLRFNRLSVVPVAAQTLNWQLTFFPEQEQNQNFLHNNVSEKMELFESRNESEIADTVEFVVNDLIATGAYGAGDIVILRAGNDRGKRRLRFNDGVRSSRQLAKPKGKPTVLETSLFQFRALTARVVILTGLESGIERLTDWKLQYFCYLLAERASEKLYVVGSSSAMTKLLPRGTAKLSTHEISQSIRPLRVLEVR